MLPSRSPSTPAPPAQEGEPQADRERRGGKRRRPPGRGQVSGERTPAELDELERDWKAWNLPPRELPASSRPAR